MPRNIAKSHHNLLKLMAVPATVILILNLEKKCENMFFCYKTLQNLLLQDCRTKFFNYCTQIVLSYVSSQKPNELLENTGHK